MFAPSVETTLESRPHMSVFDNKGNADYNLASGDCWCMPIRDVRCLIVRVISLDECKELDLEVDLEC